MIVMEYDNVIVGKFAEVSMNGCKSEVKGKNLDCSCKKNKNHYTVTVETSLAPLNFYGDVGSNPRTLA